MGVRQHAEFRITESPAGSLAPSARLRVIPGGDSLFAKDNTQMPKRLEVKAGDRYGMLVVIDEVAPVIHPSGPTRQMLCRCDCGNQSNVELQSLRSGNTRSCGCLQLNAATKHAMSHTRTYKSWVMMKDRCTNQKAKSYDQYGGRGIRVCNRWLESFPNFLDDMGERPHGMSIDRIDNDGDYEPNNCRWASVEQQGRNRRTNVRLTCNGETLCITEWAERVGIARGTLQKRRDAGWTIEDILTKPVGCKRHKTLTL